jgi:hypothetical protein
MKVPSQLPKTVKKPYEQPNLRLYGDIRTITGQTGMMGLVTDAMTGLLKSF